MSTQEQDNAALGPSGAVAGRSRLRPALLVIGVLAAIGTGAFVVQRSGARQEACTLLAQALTTPGSPEVSQAAQFWLMDHAGWTQDHFFWLYASATPESRQTLRMRGQGRQAELAEQVIRTLQDGDAAKALALIDAGMADSKAKDGGASRAGGEAAPLPVLEVSPAAAKAVERTDSRLQVLDREPGIVTGWSADKGFSVTFPEKRLRTEGIALCGIEFKDPAKDAKFMDQLVKEMAQVVFRFSRHKCCELEPAEFLTVHASQEDATTESENFAAGLMGAAYLKQLSIRPTKVTWDLADPRFKDEWETMVGSDRGERRISYSAAVRYHQEVWDAYAAQRQLPGIDEVLRDWWSPVQSGRQPAQKPSPRETFMAARMKWDPAVREYLDKAMVGTTRAKADAEVKAQAQKRTSHPVGIESKLRSNSLEAVVANHLETSLDPTAPAELTTPCVQAIEILMTGGDMSQAVRLPEPFTLHGKADPTAKDLVDAFALSQFKKAIDGCIEAESKEQLRRRPMTFEEWRAAHK